MPLRRCSWLPICVAFFACISATPANVLRVPQEYATVQTAFDAVGDDDTVLVALGTYAEELTAPPSSFWLIGDAEIDTGNFARPVIDPSELDSAQWRRCMTVPEGCKLTVERMAFINRWPMYPRPDPFVRGGVYVNSTLPITFRHCSFDSVWGAIVHDSTNIPVHYVVEDCRFTYATRTQIFGFSPGQAEVLRTFFHGYHMRGDFVNVGDGSRVEECIFTGDSIGRAVALWGEGMRLRNCIFGPIDSCTTLAFQIVEYGGSLIEGNVLRDIRMGSPDFAILAWHAGEPTLYRRNSAANISNYGSGQGTDILVMGGTAVLDSNLFRHCISAPDNNGAKAITLFAPSIIRGNHYLEMSLDSAAVVKCSSSGSQLQFNHFDAGDYGVRSASYYTNDATWNYWGHPSGPYNATYNPSGLGARVDDAVSFDPWSPDTSFLSVSEMSTPLPEEFILEAYPNPFNSSVRLRLVPVEIQIVEVELLDLLGREVAEIWRGPLAYRKDIGYDASRLASGVYFARVTDVISRRQMAIKKLMLMK